MRLIKLKAIWLPFLFFCTALTAQQKTKNNLPIGVFDSGTGGLTVLEAMLTLDAFNNITGKPGADGKPMAANRAVDDYQAFQEIQESTLHQPVEF